jgi:glutathionylspermidine synthase
MSSVEQTRLYLGAALSPELFSQIRRRMVLEYCKWDPQVGDESVLLSQPVVIDSETWALLATAAERMSSEISEVEAELLKRPEVMAELGMPAPLARLFRSRDSVDLTPVVRTLRFDFHPTSYGWKVSEVNSDVPGGFTEASYFTAMMAEHYPSTRPAGNPLRAWTSAMKQWLRRGHVAILYAPGYMEDQQIATLLGATLRREGCVVHFIQHPGGFCWRHGTAWVDGMGSPTPLDAIVRFYQGEWIAHLPRRTGWHNLFSKSCTMVTNPGRALLAESKRLPLVWAQISSATDTLQAMFPECREPHAVDWAEEDWVFKAAYSNNGDHVVVPALLDVAVWTRLRRSILRDPHCWVAQRRFVTTRVAADGGEFSPCVGVYTINGRVEGAYVRLTRAAIVDYRACEAALLVENIDKEHT